MSIITIDELISERTKLKEDFDEMKQNITKVEFDLGVMKSNLNAFNGAIQFISNLIQLGENKEAVKKKGNKKIMKKFKSFIEDENLKDFEEDVLGEKGTNTADAMKRFKAGKAGFTDKAHLAKAKGLIARSDGTKKKSDKYK